MSAIEINAIWSAIQDIRGRASAQAESDHIRMNAIQTEINELREELRDLRMSMDAFTSRLEEQLTASMKGHIDATLDVVKTDMRAHVNGLVPVGLQRVIHE